MGFTSRSVNLSWAPSLSSHGSPISHYIIHTRSQVIETFPTSSQVPLDPSPFSPVGEEGEWDVQNALVTLTNATSSQVIGLLPYTVYSFRVVAINSLGPSTPSRESYYMVTLREGTIFT
uniref:Fibronectin type-III domain-containing protein n=1 Tax=Daphnia galeata TaxID=27404 RepID=A0A8J2WM51_9CRUS|nr:unnamed protein product [Daphnia galeata]